MHVNKIDLKWSTVERPGQFGKMRDQKFKEYDERFGAGNWRIVWEVNGRAFSFEEVVMIYEDAYYFFLRDQPEVLKQLLAEGSDVYDNDLSNLESGLDYTKQETPDTHLQDIAIRRAVLRLGRQFTGDRPIQIRRASDHPLGVLLSPGRMPFHAPSIIKTPQLEGWWKPGTLESFYQSNKVLQVKVLK